MNENESPSMQRVSLASLREERQIQNHLRLEEDLFERHLELAVYASLREAIQPKRQQPRGAEEAHDDEPKPDDGRRHRQIRSESRQTKRATTRPAVLSPEEVLKVCQRAQNAMRALQLESFRQMIRATTGPAVLLPEEVLQVCQRAQNAIRALQLAPFNCNSMAKLAKQLMDCRARFQQEGKSNLTVTIGYHYTMRQNLDSIRCRGLFVSPAGTYGNGIYLANNPYYFQSHGDLGLLCATLQGRTERIFEENSLGNNRHFDTAIGNKGGGIYSCFDEIVLKSSVQCLPLASFSRASISPNSILRPADDALWKAHCELQQVVDKFFNEGACTELSYSDWIGCCGTSSWLPTSCQRIIGRVFIFIVRRSKRAIKTAVLAIAFALLWQLKTASISGHR